MFSYTRGNLADYKFQKVPHQDIRFDEFVVVGGVDVDVGGAALDGAAHVGGGGHSGPLSVLLDLVRADRVAGQLTQGSVSCIKEVFENLTLLTSTLTRNILLQN